MTLLRESSNQKFFNILAKKNGTRKNMKLSHDAKTDACKWQFDKKAETKKSLLKYFTPFTIKNIKCIWNGSS